MILEHGTIEEHMDTLERARRNGVDRVWTGDVRRNRYLQENIDFGIRNGILEVTIDDSKSQETDYLFKWLNQVSR